MKPLAENHQRRSWADLVWRWFDGLWSRVVTWRRAAAHARDYRALLRTDDNVLRDLGLTRHEIRQLLREARSRRA